MKIYTLNDIKDDKNIPKGDFLIVDKDIGYIGRFVDGKLHCDDGPARTWGSGAEEWYINGAMHRVDGPALLCKPCIWWVVNGFFIITYEDYQEATGCAYADIIALKLKWGNMQYPDGSMHVNMYVPLHEREN